VVKLVALFVTTGPQKQAFNALNHDKKKQSSLAEASPLKYIGFFQKLSNVKDRKTLFDVETYYMGVNRSGSGVTTSRLYIKSTGFPRLRKSHQHGIPEILASIFLKDFFKHYNYLNTL
jgi:hypothetical protein